MTTTEETPAAKERLVTRMGSPGVASPGETMADRAVGGRCTGWTTHHQDGEDEGEPNIVRGRE